MEPGSAAPPPPGTWSLIDGPHAAGPGGAETSRGDVQDASSAWKHCKNVARDEGRTPDLYDLLSHSVRETQYSFPPQGWPSQLRMLTPLVNEMPGMVTDRYNACQTVAFCGVFPEIRRAWASVDNSLFLWRFDKWQDVPIEYSGEEQAIVAVGLATPRPGVFVDAIRHLLVVCTTTEIVLLGVCCSAGPNGGGLESDWDHISIQPLPLYSVPSDNVAMVSVAATEDGRIFLGGADGHLYEIRYAAAGSWRQKRCAKVCHTGGLRQLLPAFLPGFLFGAPQALVDVVIDHQRHILYTRTQASSIQVYDLGMHGTEAPKRVAEITEFLGEASRALGGRDVFGRGAGDKKGAAVAHLSPVPMKESRRLQLLTITADGRRVYWSTTSSRTSSKVSGPRPDRLRAEIARQAMPSPASTARAAGGHHHAPARGLEVVAACYASGALLLAEAPRGEARTRLFLLSKDLTTPPVGTATGAHVAVAGLRESVAELDMSVPGEACAIVAVPPSSTSALQTTSSSPETFARGDATSINVAPAPRFAVVTTAGVLEVERLRPADVLAQLLQENDASKLEVFFKAYGAAEAAAMCIQLAAAGPPAAPAAVVAQAKEALDNPRLVGEPEVRDGASGIDPGTNGTSAGPMEEPVLQLGGFDMGAVVPVAEPEWSGAHKGLCLYVARLLQPAWDETVVAPMRSTQDLLRCALPTDALASLEARLRALDSFLRDFLSRKKSKRRHAGPRDPGQPATKRQRLEDAARLELRRTETMAALVARAADACFLLRALVEHNLSRLAARMDRSARAQLRGLRFRDWVSGEDGEAVASNLIAVLVSEHLGAAAGLADDLASALQSGCPSFFREADRIYYNASGLLRRAETTTTSADRRALLRDAVALLCRAPLAAELGQVIPRLALLRALDAVVELATRKAAAMDPANVAAGAAADGELLPEAEVARARREEACYAHVAAVLRVLSSPTIAAPAPLEAFQKSVTADERPLLRQELLRAVAASKDVLLQECIYAALVEVGLIKELLAIDTPALEPYLVKSSGLGGAMTGAAVGPLSASQVARGEALARLYISRGDYDSAAGVYELLASRVGAPAETPDPPLKRRIADLQSAVLQARSCGDAALVDRLEAKAGLAQLQSRMVDSLTAALERCGASNDEWNAGSGMELTREHAEAAVADMKRSLLTMEELYNDVARPTHAWADCLELLHLSGYSDPAYVRQLWDLFLKAAWQRGWDQAGGGDIERCGAGLRTAADAAAALGERFYPSEAAFPVSAVLMRLEQAAAGEWPVRAARLQLDSGVAQRAILSACNGSYDAVVRAYESLLSVRSGDPLAEVLHMPAFRLRLLKSLRDIVLSGKDRVKEREYVGAGSAMVRRELGVLAAACEAYGPEARRLPQDEGEELADEFVAIQEELQALMRHRAGSSFI